MERNFSSCRIDVDPGDRLVLANGIPHMPPIACLILDIGPNYISARDNTGVLQIINPSYAIILKKNERYQLGPLAELK